MPVFISLLFNSKIVRIGLLVVMLLAAFFGYTAYIKHSAAAQARAEVMAQVEAATEAESKRRTAVLEQAQKQAQETAAKLLETEKRNESLLAEVNKLSVANDTVPCLDPDAVERLR